MKSCRIWIINAKLLLLIMLGAGFFTNFAAAAGVSELCSGSIPFPMGNGLDSLSTLRL